MCCTRKKCSCSEELQLKIKLGLLLGIGEQAWWFRSVAALSAQVRPENNNNVWNFSIPLLVDIAYTTFLCVPLHTSWAAWYHLRLYNQRCGLLISSGNGQDKTIAAKISSILVKNREEVYSDVESYQSLPYNRRPIDADSQQPPSLAPILVSNIVIPHSHNATIR